MRKSVPLKNMMNSLETYGANVTQLKAPLGGVPTYVLSTISLFDSQHVCIREEQLVEALKAKTFKAITITHGQSQFP